MSIAVSAVITASRAQRLVLAAYALAHGAAGGFLLASAAPTASLQHGAGGVCLLAACVLARAAHARATARRIDISGLGEVRLTVQQSLGERPADPTLMQLLPGSTVWPHLLLLRLRPDSGGPVSTLAVWPDSLARTQYRALAVAVQVVAKRNNKFSGKHKIL
jgi:toxin CptA